MCTISYQIFKVSRFKRNALKIFKTSILLKLTDITISTISQIMRVIGFIFALYGIVST